MKIKKNGFYLIKDEFFKKMNDSYLPLQKNGRPMYYCIEDKNNKNIFWVIPMTTKMDKVNRIITQEGGEDKCKIYVINSSEKNSAFNIQDIFPIFSLTLSFFSISNFSISFLAIHLFSPEE